MKRYAQHVSTISAEKEDEIQKWSEYQQSWRFWKNSVVTANNETPTEVKELIQKNHKEVFKAFSGVTVERDDGEAAE